MKFYLVLASDSTFQYHESPASSHIGMGTWSVEGDVLTLAEEKYQQEIVYFYFRITEEALVFMEENTNNFSYPQVSPGERFYAIN